MNRLFILQKRAVRIITHSEYLAHTKPIFSLLKLLNVYDLYNFQCAIFMYLCYNKLLPASALIHFNLNMQVHGHQTRSSSNFHLPPTRTTTFHESIYFNGPLIWNNLPSSIRQSPSLNIFKRRYKHHLLQNYIVQ